MAQQPSRKFYIWLGALATFIIGLFIFVGNDHGDRAAYQAEHEAVMLEGAWIRIPTPSSKSAAGYLNITATQMDDRLVGATSAIAPRIEIHSVIEQDGIMSMQPLEDGLALPKGKAVQLKQGGFHFMFMGLTGAAFEQDHVDVDLVFEQAGVKTLSFPINPEDAPAPSMDHSNH